MASPANTAPPSPPRLSQSPDGRAAAAASPAKFSKSPKHHKQQSWSQLFKATAASAAGHALSFRVVQSAVRPALVNRAFQSNKEKLAEIKEKFKALGGSDFLIQYLDKMDFKIVELLEKNPTARGLIKDKKPEVVEAIKITLYTGLVNIGLAIEEEFEIEEGEALSLPNIVNFIGQLVESNYEEGLLSQKYANLSQEQICEALLAPLLEIAFPNRENDLPIAEVAGSGLLKSTLWSIIQSQSLEYTSKCYLLMMESTAEVDSKRSFLEQQRQGKLILHFSKVLSFFIANALVRKNFQKRDQQMVVKVTTTALEVLFGKNYNGEDLTKEFSALISANVVELAGPNSPLIWEFVQKRIEAFLINTLFNLGSGTAGTNGDISNTPVNELLEMLKGAFSHLYVNHGFKLTEYRRIAAHPIANEAREKLGNEEREKLDSEERRVWISQVFTPIANQFVQSSGIFEDPRVHTLELVPLINELPLILFDVYGVVLTQLGPETVEGWFAPNREQEVRFQTLHPLYQSLITKFLPVVFNKSLKAMDVKETAKALTETIGKKTDAMGKVDIFKKEEDEKEVKEKAEGEVKQAAEGAEAPQQQAQAAEKPLDALEDILADKLHSFINDNSHPLRPFVLSHIKNIVIHIFTKIQRNPVVFFHQLFSLIKEQFTPDFLNSITDDVLKLQNPDLNPALKKAIQDKLAQKFQPLSKALITQLGLNEMPMLALFDMNKEDGLLEKIFSNLIVTGYVALSKPVYGKENTFKEFCKLLFDQNLFNHDPQLAQQALALQDQGVEKDASKWRASGSEDLAKDTLNAIDAFIAPFCLEIAKSFFGKVNGNAEEANRNRDKMVQLLNESLELNLDAAGHEALGQILQGFVNSSLAGNREFWTFAEKIVGTILSKAILNTVKTVEAAKAPVAQVPGQPPQHHLSQLIDDVVIHFAKLIKDYVVTFPGGQPALEARIVAIEALPENERAPALKALFLPLVTSILGLMGNDVNNESHPLSHLPLSAELKQKLWVTIIPNALGDFFASGYRNIFNKEKMVFNKADLDASHSHRDVRAQLLSEILGGFTAFKMPGILKDNKAIGDSLTDKAKESLQKDASSGERQDLAARFDINNPESPLLKKFQALANAEVQQLGLNNNPQHKELWSFVGHQMTQPLVYKLLTGLTDFLIKVDNTNPDFRMTAMKLALNGISEHFKAVNEATTALRRRHPHEVLPQDMLAQFKIRGKLHPALDVSNLNDKKAVAERKKKFFIVPLTQKIIKIAGIKPSDMPVPAPMQQNVYELLCNEIGPEILGSIYESLISSNSCNSMLISLSQNLMETFQKQLVTNRLLHQNAQPNGNAPQAQPDEHLNEECGKVIKSLAERFPWIIQQALNLPVGENVDKMLGAATKDLIKDFDFKTILEKAFKATIEGLASGYWLSSQKYVRTKLVYVNGEFKYEALANGEEPSFYTPRTPQELQAFLQWQQKEEASKTDKAGKSLYQALNTGLTDVMSKKMTDALRNYIDACVDRVFDFIFRGFSGPIKGFVKGILNFIGYILYIPLYPFAAVLKLFQSLYLGWQLKTSVKNLSHPITENMVMHLMDCLVQELLSVQVAAQPAGVPGGLPLAAAVPEPVQVAVNQPQQMQAAPQPPSPKDDGA